MVGTINKKTCEETINLIKKTNEPNELIVLGGIHNQENEILKREKINISTICSVKHRLSLKDQIINSTEIANNIIFKLNSKFNFSFK